MRALFIQHDHVSPLGPVGERFAHHGFDIDTVQVVDESQFGSPNVLFTFPEAGEYDVIVPLGAVEIARNPVASQAFTIRRSLAVQFHPELDAAGLKGWLDWGGAAKVKADGQDPAVMLAQTRAEEGAARERTFALVDAFLTEVAGLPTRA